MKKLMLLLAAAALLALGAGQALAQNTSTHQLKTVTVVMHDPGCHWFSVNGKFQKSLTVQGPVKFLGLDEAALKLAGPNGVKLAKVGVPIVLGRGIYKITMVKQAPDDNHLTLTVK